MHASDDNTVLLDLALQREGDALSALGSRRRWRWIAALSIALNAAAALAWWAS